MFELYILCPYTYVHFLSDYRFIKCLHATEVIGRISRCVSTEIGVKIQTLEKIAVITLKFEQGGVTIE